MSHQSPYLVEFIESVDGIGGRELSVWIYPRVFRCNFDEPGFALVQFTHDITSHQLRQIMVAMKEELSNQFQQHHGAPLTYLSLTRFDQQVTTKFHLDGAPEQAFLILGYEPSKVRSEIALADYSRAGHELKITPRAFLETYNPMFAHGAEQLAPYTTKLTSFDAGRPQLLLINNSSQAYDTSGKNQLGVMHQATIVNPSSEHLRVVNSIMLGANCELKTTPDEVERFLKTMEVAARF